ncbi:hypothetical protein DL764_002147 [Monosporascus ibericus]|uniref:LysR family regulatory protein n=1 Tax=Monosporascus ibericus TaxID=155417 RepID=A0A4Q4TLJ1_9PEZI|nr:hypothetical protein DL764_002147 [Monosporascus ibericus]
MGNLFSKPKPQAPRVLTDTVVPLHKWDDQGVNRAIIMLFMMRFDDVLDPEKLRSSLEKLLSRDDCRRLGARLRLNDKGKLEYHIPEQFDEKRPAVAYSHVKYGVAIGEHPLASRLPRPSAKPSALGDPNEFWSLMRREDGPTEIADYYARDEPQLSLHVVSFEDATLVSLTWPHTLLDAMGYHELLTAWTAVLKGRDGDVKPLHSVDHDPLATHGSEPREPYVLADKRLSKAQKVLFIFRYAYELLRYRDEERMICVPAAYVEKLRARAVSDLVAARGDATEKPFVSEGDVLSAWVTRALTRAVLAPTSDKTIMVVNAFGLRWVLADDRLPRDKAYVSNAIASVYTYLSVKDLLTKPLGSVAGAVRQAIVEQGTSAQLETRRFFELEAVKSGWPALYGDGWMNMLIVSNWSKGRFFEMDFSAAVVREGGGTGRTGKAGRPSYIQNRRYMKNFSSRGAIPVVGKDGAGNYWLQSTARKGFWDKIQNAMDEESP